ncbi:transcriptional regulator [Sandaracinobacter sp.]|uniref:winged helix-turn-helix domain-containing protein n=1 Tax=Sandaracinobacter sp. TaxID=2487581 RepID=UPI0035AFC637
MRVRIGEQVLDMTRFELSRDGEAAHVEPQVLRLIAHLVARAGQLVTRDELIREVWGGRIVSDTAISSRIKSARAALGDSGEAQRCIRTVHGHGFRFVAPVEDLVPAAPATRQDLPDVAARPSIAVLPFATLGD